MKEQKEPGRSGRRKYLNQFKYRAVLLFLLALAVSVWTGRLVYLSEASRLNDNVTASDQFRSQPVNSEILEQLREVESPGEALGIYWLETGFGKEQNRLSLPEMEEKRKRWERAEGWKGYLNACQAVWDDAVYFPIPEAEEGSRLTVTFENSWMFSRSYKGERGHEGTDIMPSVNERGLFPVVSMTDGIIRNIGWLELGGWRIGIEAPRGAYIYYAHLDSYADIEEGDEVKAGDFLGFMGDSGYGTEEGTRGKFPVHLHLGIYLYDEEQEISVNPYPVLKYVEERRVQWRKSAI